MNSLCHAFATYGVPEELALDVGPEFEATLTKEFLQTWGVHHRLSSVAFPHSNNRAEVGVKSAKRIITNNTGPNGCLDVNAVQRAILLYRNTPDPTTKLSLPSYSLDGPLGILSQYYLDNTSPHKTWQESLLVREEVLRNRHMLAHERCSKHTRRLQALIVCDIRIQNQIGHHPNRWDKTGTVIEVHQFHQYVIRLNGSRRVTLRNRKFLLKYIPFTKPLLARALLDDLRLLQPTTPTTLSPAHLVILIMRH